jgi:Tol biopolymer transport system component
MARHSIARLACTLTLALAGCGGGVPDGAPARAPAPAPAPAAVTQQLVFMWAADGHVGAAGPDVDYEIALINVDGSDFRQLTSDGKQKFLPHFSPDGKKLVYTKFLQGGFGSPEALSEIAVFDLASGQETIVTSGGDNGYGTWSPDGRRIAYLRAARLGSASTEPTTLITIAPDGSNPQAIGAASGAADDWVWGDIAWSRDNWILFVVGQNTAEGSFCNSRIDKIRPDGSQRTQVTDGGPDCTPPGKEAIGDADPGWSSDGQTIFSSHGLPLVPAGLPASSLVTERKLYALSSDPWVAGKPYVDLSLPSEPACVEGVPKGSPDGARVALFRACYDGGAASTPGVYVTDTLGSYRSFVVLGFGPDWNPLAEP